MRDSKVDDSFCPRKTKGLDFSFALNDRNFSDRVLRIEIIPDWPETKSDGEGDTGVADWAARNTKTLREEKDTDSFVGDEAAPGNDSLLTMDCSTVLCVKTIHISSPILAAKSPFFFKLFSNGMRESGQQHVTLRIHASEEAAIMDLLNFMYSNTLSTTTLPALLDVLMAADKFEVVSCMRYCSKLLRNLPMTCESALLYLDLPSSVLMAAAVQPLADSVKQFLVARYKDITKFPDEVLNLPVAGIQPVLSSDALQVTSEDVVFDLVLKWARTHYPKLEDRREILRSRLACLIRFPHMTWPKLKRVLTCNDFDPNLASRQLVIMALCFKADAPYRQRSPTPEKASAIGRQFMERAYKHRAVQVVEFQLPRKKCIVYLDLKREECVPLFPAAMSKSTEEYVSMYKGYHTFTGPQIAGRPNLFGTTDFMADNSPYFINGVLHLRVELTIRQ